MYSSCLGTVSSVASGWKADTIEFILSRFVSGVVEMVDKQEAEKQIG